MTKKAYKKEKLNKQAFTIIELLVIIAVLAIIVLLAVPRFTGMVDRARVARITNDIKVVEGKVAEHLLHNDNVNDWDGPILISEIENLYNTRGKVDENNLYKPGAYYAVADKLVSESRSKLDGTFYANNDGLVYYSDTTLEGGSLSDDEIDDLIENYNYIPVANATELAQINGLDYDNGEEVYEELTWGAGTRWETETTGKLDSNYIQVKDIDLAHIDDWVPIGANYPVPFSGNYNGGKFYISNLKITESNTSPNSALFGTVHAKEDIEIKNIKLKNANINKNGGNAGLLIGHANGNEDKNLVVDNIYVEASSIINSNGSAGVIGFNTGILSRISNVHSNSVVKASDNAGGLIGYNVGSKYLSINDITIEGSIEATSIDEFSINSGGVIGNQVGNIKELKGISVSANVISNKNAGGLLGGNHSSQKEGLVIDNIRVEGNITANHDKEGHASAIIAQNTTLIKEIKNIEIVSNVKSAGRAAGLIAGNHAGNMPINIDSVSFSGDIIAEDYAGGLIAHNTTTLGKVNNINIYSDVNSTSGLAGGLFGISTNGTADGSVDAGIIDTVYFEGEINGHGGVGGVSANNTGNLSSISNVSIKSKMTSGDGAGTYNEGSAGGLLGVNYSMYPLKLSNIDVEGEIKGYRYVGGVIGATSVSVEYDNINMSADISVEKLTPEALSYAGGLVGYNVGGGFSIPMNDITIEADISGVDSIGGLLGYNVVNVEHITNLSMSVNLSNSAYMGSLMGEDYSSGTTNMLYSNISGEMSSANEESISGGLYGKNYSSSNKKLIIKDTTVSINHKGLFKYAGGVIGELIEILTLDLDDLKVISSLQGETIGQFIGLYSDRNELNSSVFNFSGAIFNGSGATSKIGEEKQL